MNLKLRLALGIGIVALGVVFGAAQRAPWMILGHALVLFSVFVEEKRPHWGRFVSFSGGSAEQALLKAGLGHIVIAAATYLIGFGAAALFSGRTDAAPLAFWDLATLAAALLAGLLVMHAIRRSEGGRDPYELALADLDAASQDDDADEDADWEREGDEETEPDADSSDIERAVERDDRRGGGTS